MARRKGPPPERIDKVAWEDPPVRKQFYAWDSIAEQLRAKPNEWARVFQQDRVSVVNALRQGAVGPMHPDLGFEYKTVNNVREPVRLCDLYARWNPDKVVSLRAAIRRTRKKA